MSRSRCRTSRSRHRAISRRTDAGVEAGSAAVEVLPQDRRQGVGDVLALKRALARQHLGEHGAERPDVAALVRGLPRACSGLM